MWLVLAVGEDWRTLSGGEYENIVHDIWINDYKITDMENYTENESLKDENHSWYRFYPGGTGINFPWSVSGKHVFTQKADPIAESYSLICTRDANQGDGPVTVTVRTIHEWPEAGANQQWRVKVIYQEEVPEQSEFDSGWQSHYFYATQTVKAGKSSTTQRVPGTEERIYSWDLPYRGKFKVQVEIDPSSQGGVYLDSVEVNDPGGFQETCNFNGTSCLLIRIIDNTGELARPTVSVLAEGGPNNPADALKWLLTNEELGRGVPEEHIDKGAFADVAEAMDAYGYTYNRAICQQSAYEMIQQEMCTCGRILLAEWNGMHTPFVDEEFPSDQVPEINLDDQAVAGSLSYSQKALKDVPNSFEIKYVDSDIDYTLQDLLTDDAALQARVRTVNKQTISVLGTTRQNKAWELGWYQIQYLKSDMTLSFEPLPILWGTLYPGYVFKAVSSQDPLVNGTEWLVVGIDETEPGRYVVKATQYRREAYHAPALTEWVPDVWIPGGVLGVSEGPTESTAGMYVMHTVEEHSSTEYVRVHFSFHNVPTGAKRIRIYRSYTGYLDGGVVTTGYERVSDVMLPETTAILIEPVRYSAVYFRFPVVDDKGEQSPLESSPRATVYPFLTLDGLPGYGYTEYGRGFYGG